MPDFGKYAPEPYYECHFILEPEWWVRLKKATAGDQANLEMYVKVPTLAVADDGSLHSIPPTSIMLAMRKIALCWAGTNIPADSSQPVEDGGQPVLRENASIDEVETFLNTMPTDMVFELWIGVGKINPDWGPILDDPDNSNEDKDPTKPNNN